MAEAKQIEMVIDDKLLSVESKFKCNEFLKYKAFDEWISEHKEPARSVSKFKSNETICVNVSNCTMQDNGYDCGLCSVLNLYFVCKRFLKCRDFIKNFQELTVKKSEVTMTPVVMGEDIHEFKCEHSNALRHGMFQVFADVWFDGYNHRKSTLSVSTYDSIVKNIFGVISSGFIGMQIKYAIAHDVLINNDESDDRLNTYLSKKEKEGSSKKDKGGNKEDKEENKKRTKTQRKTKKRKRTKRKTKRVKRKTKRIKTRTKTKRRKRTKRKTKRKKKKTTSSSR